MSVLEDTRSLMPEGFAPKWWWQLRVNAMGVPRPVAYNAAIALTQDLAFSGAIRYDRLSHRVTLCRGVPCDPHPVVIPRPWKASDDVSATLWLQENQIMVRTTVVREVVHHIAQTTLIIRSSISLTA